MAELRITVEARAAYVAARGGTLEDAERAICELLTYPETGLLRPIRSPAESWQRAVGLLPAGGDDRDYVRVRRRARGAEPGIDFVAVFGPGREDLVVEDVVVRSYRATRSSGWRRRQRQWAFTEGAIPVPEGQPYHTVIALDKARRAQQFRFATDAIDRVIDSAEAEGFAATHLGAGVVEVIA